MKKYPNVTIKIIFRFKDKILMLKHKSGIFDFPGGRMKWGESILGTLKRELKEELGCSLEKDPKLFDVWNYIAKNKRRHSVFIYFIQKLNKKHKFSISGKFKIIWLTNKDFVKTNIIKDKKFLNKIFN